MEGRKQRNTWEEGQVDSASYLMQPAVGHNKIQLLL